jgi:hypothetical protein
MPKLHPSSVGVVCGLSQVCNGYSILTHEEIVDLLWAEGEYTLTDETYAKLLNKLMNAKFAGIQPEVRNNILAFYQDPSAPNFTRKKREQWDNTQRELEQLKAIEMTQTATQ